MNGDARKEGATMRIVGREFIVAVVVVFSSLSFTLGYFVGRNNAEKRPEPVVQAVPKPAGVEPQPAAQPQTPRAEGESVGGDKPAQDMKADQKTVSIPPGESHNEGRAAGAQKVAVNSAQKEDPKKETGESSQTDAGPHKSGTSDVVYTVQLGALKNAEEARQLKAKYVKKGYKIYIMVVRSKNKAKIYKVRTGEFTDKKDAEILALRIKKNDGLSAFVTVKND